MLNRKITVVDGPMLLVLEPAEEGGYIVTSPADPEVNTQGETIEQCIENARDAAATIAAGRLAEVQQRVKRSTKRQRAA